MPVEPFTVDAAASKLVIRTRAQGLLARLAHDLELVTHAIDGTATLDGDAWTAELRVAPASIHVAGVVRGAELAQGVLSIGDREEIERRVRADVLGAAPEVVVQASGASRSGGEATVALGPANQRVPLSIRVTPMAEGALAVAGRFEVSLRALGAPQIKGPLGAFSVKDAIEIGFALVLRPLTPPRPCLVPVP